MSPRGIGRSRERARSRAGLRRLVSLGAILGLAACGGGATRPPARAPSVPRLPAWAAALVPEQNDAEVRVDRYPGGATEHVALVFGGRVYGSSGDDVPTMVAAPLLALALGPARGRTAVIGIGAGVELGLLLAAGAAPVDLYEPSPALLEQAAALSDVSGLRFEAGRPVHAALTVLAEPPRGPPPRYAAIVHATGMTVISEPHRLFTVERLRALGELLEPGGVVVLHLQLYEIREETLKDLLRTFVAALPHAALFVPEDLSSDAFLVGSDAPVAIALDRASELLARPALHGYLERSGYGRPAALAVSALLASEAEVRAYCGDGRVLTEARPLRPTELPRRPPLPAGPEPSWERWEAECERFREQNGYEDTLAARFYDPAWAWGRPCRDGACPLVRDAPTGAATAPWLVELARAAMEHGRLAWAADFLDAAATRGPSPEIDRANRVLLLLGQRALAVADPLDAAPPRLEGEAARALEAALALGRTGAWDEAAGKLEEVSREPLVSGAAAAGGVRLLAGAAWLRAGRSDDAARVLDALASDDAATAFVEAHPEVYYLLGRALVEQQENGGAAEAMRRYVEAQERQPRPAREAPAPER